MIESYDENEEMNKAIKCLKLIFRLFILFIIFLITLILFALSKPLFGQTVEQVQREVIRQQIKHADIVTAQSILETGWYDCDMCSMRFNNIFGFRLSSKAEPGNKLGYLKFDTWQESVTYYKDWQDRHYKKGDYFDFLKNRGYAEHMDKYIEKVEWIIKTQEL